MHAAVATVGDSLTAWWSADLVGHRKLDRREWRYAPAAIGASGAVTAIVILGCCTNPTAIVYVYGAAVVCGVDSIRYRAPS